MSTGSRIEWTEATWNPTTGCDRVSPGCDHCYALSMAARLKAAGQPKYQRDGNPATSGPGFGLTTHDDALTLPLRWHKPRRVFVNSMSDLFHEKVPDEFIASVFAVMATSLQHTFQVLTKRHGRMRSLLNKEWFKVWTWVAQAELRGTCMPNDTWPLPNVWLGVSVENQQWADIRIPALLETPAAIRWISAEPLLGPIDLHANDNGIDSHWLPDFGPDYDDDDARSPICQAHGWPDCSQGCTFLDWVVTGGESGPGYRGADPDWFRQIRDQCVAAGVAYLHKQNGGRTPKAGGRELDGRTWDEYPDGDERDGVE